MITFIFTKQAERAFTKLPKSVQDRCLEKLHELKTHSDIFVVLKQLTAVAPATHRLRIGNYRLILELRNRTKQGFEFWILDVGHRKDIYR